MAQYTFIKAGENQVNICISLFYIFWRMKINLKWLHGMNSRLFSTLFHFYIISNMKIFGIRKKSNPLQFWCFEKEDAVMETETWTATWYYFSITFYYILSLYLKFLALIFLLTAMSVSYDSQYNFNFYINAEVLLHTF